MALQPVKINRTDDVVEGKRLSLRFYAFLDYLYNLAISNTGSITTITSLTAPVTELTVSDSPYTVSADVYSGTYMVDASGGDVEVILPTVTIDNYFVVKKVDSSINTVTASSADGIDGALTAVLTVQYESISMVASSTTYNII